MDFPQTQQSQIFQIIQPYILKLNQQKYTKYLSSIVAFRIAIFKDIFLGERLLREDLINYTNFFEDIKQMMNNLKDQCDQLIKGEYFKIFGNNQKYIPIFIKIQDILNDLVKLLLQNNFNFNSSHLRIGTDIYDMADKLDEAVQKARLRYESEIKDGQYEKNIQCIQNELTFIVWINGRLESINSITAQDIFKILCKFSLQEINKSININLPQFFNRLDDNKLQNVQDFMIYGWTNPEFQSQIHISYNIPKVQKLLVLKVIQNHFEEDQNSFKSNFEIDQEIYINELGLVEQSEESKRFGCGRVKFGRKTLKNPVDNDVYFHKDENKISRRQFEIGYDVQSQSYSIMCTSLINYTEFLVTQHYNYPVTNGTVIGFSDIIFFEIQGLTINNQEQQSTINKTELIKNELTSNNESAELTVNLNKNKNIKPLLLKQEDYFDENTLPDKVDGSINNYNKTGQQIINEEDQSIQICIQFLRKQYIPNNKIGEVFHFKSKKSITVVFGEQQENSDIFIKCNKYPERRSFRLLLQGGLWTLNAEERDNVSIQLKKQSDKMANHSEKYMLRDKEVIQVLYNRFQVELRKK